MRASENRSDIEAELKSEEPTKMGGDTSSSKDEGGRDIVATSVEHHEPVVVSASGRQDMERRGDVLASRKHAMSSKAIIEREAKRTQSP